MIKVVAGLIWCGGRVLICQRPENKSQGLLWEFAGGKVEDGENDEDALRRELMEELGIEVSVGDEFTAVTHSYPDKTIHMTVYNAQITGGTPELKEHRDFRWAAPAEMHNFEFCPADIPVAEKIMEQYN